MSYEEKTSRLIDVAEIGFKDINLMRVVLLQTSNHFQVILEEAVEEKYTSELKFNDLTRAKKYFEYAVWSLCNDPAL